MGIETAIGLGISGLGSILGGRSQERAGNNARNDAMQQQANLRQMISPYLGQQGQMGAAESYLQNHLSQFGQVPGGPGRQGGPYRFNPIDAAQVNGPDAGSIFGGSSYNAGQDALMQMLRADPSTKVAGLQENLSGILNTGNPFDTTALMRSLDQSNALGQQDALTQLRGGYGSLGQRFGSAAQHNESDLLRRLTSDASTQRAGIVQGSFEAAQGRRLNAGGLLSGLEGQRGQQMLGAIGLGNQQTGQRLDLAQLIQQAGLANQQSTNQTNQFNAQQGLAGYQTNLTAGSNAQQQMLQALGLLGGFGQQRQGNINQLLSLIAGQQTPGANPAAGATAGAIGDVGNTFALLPYFSQLFGGARA